MDIPQNDVQTPRIIDLTPLLHDLERQIEEVEQEARVLQLRLARVRGLRDGVLMAVERANHATAVVTEGPSPGEPAPAPSTR